jgi:hypothetical protein
MTTPPSDTPPPSPGPADSAPAAAPAPDPKAERRRRFRRKLELIWLSVLLFLVLGFAVYTTIMANYAYSEGSKAGYLQVFEDRGWLCKTHEGELLITSAPGVAPETWHFTVRNKGLAATLRPAVGKRVLVYYEEHRGLPTNCFGATNFFVDSVVVTP